MSDGLTIVSETGATTTYSLKVYGITSTDEETELTLLDTGSTSKDGYTLTVNGQTITVSFADLKSVANYANYTSIEVRYEATLNTSAVLGTLNSGNTNTVKVTYSNNPNWDGQGTEPTGTTTEEKVYVNTYELKVTKNASDTNEAIEGAIFVLYYIDANLETQYAQLSKDVTSGIYTITGWSTDDPMGTAAEATSDSNGLIKIDGLDASVKYYLKEIKAPDGYNLLADAVEFTITATTGDNGELKTLTVDNTTLTADSETGVVSTNIVNYAGTKIPSTGGIGTTIFYIVGAVLVIGAGVVLITRRRMASR